MRESSFMQRDMDASGGKGRGPRTGADADPTFAYASLSPSMSVYDRMNMAAQLTSNGNEPVRRRKRGGS